MLNEMIQVASATNTDNVRHHTGAPVCVKLAELRQV